MNIYLAIALAAVIAALITFIVTYIVMKGRENVLENELIVARESQKTAESMNETVKAQMMAQTEQILKQREEALTKQAEETFRNLTGVLGKDIKNMQDAFEAQKRSQTEAGATLKTVVEQAVKHLQEQTSSIGTKADNLAQALKGQNKMAGTWGEIVLARTGRAVAPEHAFTGTRRIDQDLVKEAGKPVCYVIGILIKYHGIRDPRSFDITKKRL